MENVREKRLILFIAGIVLIVLASVTVYPEFLGFAKSLCCWNVLLLVYLVAFAPLVFKFKDENKTGSIFIAGGVYYTGVKYYGVALALITILKLTDIIGYLSAVVLQFIALFVYVVYFYLSYASAKHIDNVHEQENGKVYNLDEIKNEIKILKVKVDSLDGHQEVKKLFASVSDNIRYLSPSDDDHAVDLEIRMLNKIQEINNTDLILNHSGSDNELIKLLKDLDVLYQERKSIY